MSLARALSHSRSRGPRPKHRVRPTASAGAPDLSHDNKDAPSPLPFVSYPTSSVPGTNYNSYLLPSQKRGEKKEKRAATASTAHAHVSLLSPTYRSLQLALERDRWMTTRSDWQGVFLVNLFNSMISNRFVRKLQAGPSGHGQRMQHQGDHRLLGRSS